jgi:hypothetical protein
MHGTPRTRPAIQPTGTGVNAVVWIERGRALVVRETPTGGYDEVEVLMPDAPATTPVALAEVAHQIGHADRILVMGPDDLRTALEREIVAIGHAPETIREHEVEGPVDREILFARLHRLS